MIKFIHTADFHFGVENYGRNDAKTGIHTRLIDFNVALNTCIDCALEKQVDFFLFCGDAYKTTNPSPTQQKLLVKSLLRLHAANIPVVVVVGNHDNPLSFGKAHSLDVFDVFPLDGFHVISKPKMLKLKTRNGMVQIVGIPWPTRSTVSITSKHFAKSGDQLTDYIREGVAALIGQQAKKLDPSIPAVLAGHLTVSNGVFSGSEKRAIYGNDPCILPSQLAIEPFDYVALGHLHRYQDLNPNGYPSIVYSGSIERIDFGERKEEKGFCVVSIPEKNRAEHEFIQLSTRPFIQVEVVLSQDKDQTEQIVSELKKHVLDDAVVKIRYHVPEGVKDGVSLRSVEQACGGAHYIAGIFPIRKHAERKVRASMKITMDFEKLLGAYLDDKPELSERRQEIVRRALELHRQVLEM